MTEKETIRFHFEIPGDDLSAAGEASSQMKMVLRQLGLPPELIRRTAISMYEAEINTVIHAGGGTADVEISEDEIKIVFVDSGPGIENIELAMSEGYSTAPDRIREMGFGAGMGLPNIKRFSDKLDIETEVGKGTKVTILMKLR